MSKKAARYGTAENRWAGVGPYYAMFPASFAKDVILNNTDKGDIVLDPFAGRGTSVYSAATNERSGIGIEINPVGWLYSKAKLHPASKAEVERRLEEIGSNVYRYQKAAKQMPTFFNRCYASNVREFLLTARSWLNWRQCKVDWTLMALLLVHLHGKRTDSFSNQMRQTKSMSPPYAIRWWKEHGHKPPKLDPVEFMKKKLDWRFAKGVPTISGSEVYLGDSVVRLPHVGSRLESFGNEKAQLLFTSPPYCGVTNYHYDQWLRLWLLGGPTKPKAPADAQRGKFVDRVKYRDLLTQVFTKAALLLADSATVYVRTDSRELTRNITCEVLAEVFPEMRIRRYNRPSPEKTQTDLFGGSPETNGETDIILRKRKGKRKGREKSGQDSLSYVF